MLVGGWVHVCNILSDCSETLVSIITHPFGSEASCTFTLYIEHIVFAAPPMCVCASVRVCNIKTEFQLLVLLLLRGSGKQWQAKPRLLLCVTANCLCALMQPHAFKVGRVKMRLRAGACAPVHVRAYLNTTHPGVKWNERPSRCAAVSHCRRGHYWTGRGRRHVQDCGL